VLHDLNSLSNAVRLLHLTGAILPRQVDEYERYVRTHSQLEAIGYGHIISRIHCAVCSEPGSVQPEWTDMMHNLDLSTNNARLWMAFVQLENEVGFCCDNEKVWVCSRASAASAFFGMLCGLGLHSLQYNSGSLALAEHTACRIRNLIAKIGDSIMFCGDQPVVQYLARRLYVAISWYRRFGNDSQPVEDRGWSQFEDLRHFTAVAFFHLEEWPLESRWSRLFPFASWPYTHEDEELFLPPLP
jgi:hypothetical protein